MSMFKQYPPGTIVHLRLFVATVTCTTSVPSGARYRWHLTLDGVALPAEWTSFQPVVRAPIAHDPPRAPHDSYSFAEVALGAGTQVRVELQVFAADPLSTSATLELDPPASFTVTPVEVIDPKVARVVGGLAA